MKVEIPKIQKYLFCCDVSLIAFLLYRPMTQAQPLLLSKSRDDGSASPLARRRVSAIELQRLLSDGAELALLDVRDGGQFSAGHIFAAVSLPLNRMEWLVDALVPRRDTRMVLVDDCDAQDGMAAIAAGRLAAWGYSNLSLLGGGLSAWKAAGLQVFSGVYVPSKAFGEYVEHACATPCISAATLRDWMRSGKDMLLLDSRPYEEFHRYSLPGGIACPGAELVHRVFGLVDNDQTTIVVNCAGRTRGIIGAQALINAGIANPVVVVENGTAGWHLSGGTLVHARTEVAPPPTPRALHKAIAASQRIARRFGVSEIDAGQLAALRQRSGRNLYLLDVRTPEEYQAGHLPGSRSAPGGQLVQSTDDYVGVRNACLVLVDDNGVRARVTASWLLQMGCKDVHVLRDGLHSAGAALRRGWQGPRILGGEHLAQVDWLPVFELKAWLEQPGQALVVDLDDSLTYAAGHIPGAWFAVRSRLRQSLGRLPEHRLLVLASRDGQFAALAAADAQAASRVPVRVLRGGTQAWRTAGLPCATGFQHMADRNDDIWYSPYDHDDRSAAMTAYLQWEVDLLGQISKESGVDFNCAAAAQDNFLQPQENVR
ncbi:thiosulfate sulfurtransferase [Verminephrobacter eiseniae]|uniref:rhodanese-like domain-containing protein n=2 Tax=Verminephrobacter eiseniae TaxID=364317 RepID=UPI0000DCE943|nr:rhodanese-like domain-containing protein [Verminephrobacter eiseniae]MCW5284744.1 thiosulfate sulfurtransferase [Verminephrobacter eiseniae]MCW5302450.1 thiosulfate sulfurtransferase [Verminephrobacter eiseniae]MCW8178501.1 thiosulfate sulfurtransferase [Verminephrobacter eiseniae]MCW8189271.1 thiosulfate sulfurtransferase [Verminephrobacter eiseniae]